MARLYSSSTAKNVTTTTAVGVRSSTSSENIRCFLFAMRWWMARTCASTGMGLAAMCSDSSRNTSRRAKARAAHQRQSPSSVTSFR